MTKDINRIKVVLETLLEILAVDVKGLIDSSKSDIMYIQVMK